MTKPMPVVVALVAAMGVQSAPYSTVSSGIRADEYVGVVYAARPAGDVPFMFYAGDRIKLKADFVNAGPRAQTVRWDGRSGKQLFSAEVTRDGAPVAIRVEFNRAVYVSDAGDDKPVALGSSLTLAADEKVSFDGQVNTGGAEPGVYMIELTTDATDGDGRPIAPQSTRLQFELRAATGGERSERTRRKAFEALSDGNLADADRLSSQMLAGNPDSYAAYVVRGQIAEARGRTADALASYRRALDILENSRDREYPAPTGSLGRDEQIAGLRNLIRELSGK
jgi:hypothetical protein